MKHNIDLQIKCLRRMIFEADTDEEAYQYMVRLDALQRERYQTKGSFLPARDGQIWAYMPDYDRWVSMAA